MPHTAECHRRVVEFFGPHAYEGWCVGAGCTFTREDYPLLWKIVNTGIKQKEDTMTTFEVTEDHLKLVKRMYWDWNGDWNGDVPTVSVKRPYGNSDVVGDIVEILELPTITDRYGDTSFTEETADRAIKIHREMATVLQIATCTLSFEPGVYEKTETYNSLSWKKVEANATD